MQRYGQPPVLASPSSVGLRGWQRPALTAAPRPSRRALMMSATGRGTEACKSGDEEGGGDEGVQGEDAPGSGNRAAVATGRVPVDTTAAAAVGVGGSAHEHRRVAPRGNNLGSAATVRIPQNRFKYPMKCARSFARDLSRLLPVAGRGDRAGTCGDDTWGVRHHPPRPRPRPSPPSAPASAPAAVAPSLPRSLVAVAATPTVAAPPAVAVALPVAAVAAAASAVAGDRCHRRGRRRRGRPPRPSG